MKGKEIKMTKISKKAVKKLASGSVKENKGK